MAKRKEDGQYNQINCANLNKTQHISTHETSKISALNKSQLRESMSIGERAKRKRKLPSKCP